jgi:hypothetical protein
MRTDDKVDQFSSLPLEVKEMIYEHALRAIGCFDKPLRFHLSDCHNKDRPRLPLLPGFCLTNKLERSISTLVLARNTILRLSFDINSILVLRSMDAIGVPKIKFMAAVKKIQVEYDIRVGCVDDNLFFASECQGVADLSITIEWQDLEEISETLYECDEDSDTEDEDDEGTSRDQVLGNHGLHGIAKCQALTRLTFQIPNFRIGVRTGWIDHAHVDRVAELYQEAFLEADGRALHVEMAVTTHRCVVGKDVKEDSSDRMREYEGIDCHGDEALHWNFD